MLFRMYRPDGSIRNLIPDGLEGTHLLFSDTLEGSDIVPVEVVEARPCVCFKIPALCLQAPSSKDHCRWLYDDRTPCSRAQILVLLERVVSLALRLVTKKNACPCCWAIFGNLVIVAFWFATMAFVLFSLKEESTKYSGICREISGIEVKNEMKRKAFRTLGIGGGSGVSRTMKLSRF